MGFFNWSNPLVSLPILGFGGTLVRGAQQAQNQQRQALAQQDAMQRDAIARANAQQQNAIESFRAANQQQPDIGSLLLDEQKTAGQGIGQTLLTGPLGIDPQRLKLGRATLLGD